MRKVKLSELSEKLIQGDYDFKISKIEEIDMNRKIVQVTILNMELEIILNLEIKDGIIQNEMYDTYFDIQYRNYIKEVFHNYNLINFLCDDIGLVLEEIIELK